MTWLDDIVRDVSDTALGILETTATLVRETESGFDPYAEAANSPTESSTTFKSSPVLNYKESEIDGARVIKGDVRVLLSPKGQTVTPTPEADKLTIDGETFRVIAVGIVKGGTQNGLLKVQLRR